jgi:hypothetical protein
MATTCRRFGSGRHVAQILGRGYDLNLTTQETVNTVRRPQSKLGSLNPENPLN